MQTPKRPKIEVGAQGAAHKARNVLNMC